MTATHETEPIWSVNGRLFRSLSQAEEFANWLDARGRPAELKRVTLPAQEDDQ